MNFIAKDGPQVRFPHDFDRRHSLDVVLNFLIDSDLNENERMNISFTWRFGSGFPYTPALGVEPLVAIIMDPNNPDNLKPTILTDPETGTARFIPTFGGPENINSLRYSPYHRLDARVTFITKLFNADLKFFADFINIYNRKNVLFFRSIIKTVPGNPDIPKSLRFPLIRAFEEPVYMYPFLPSIGASISF